MRSETVRFLARNLLLGGAERAFLHYVNHVRAFTSVALLLNREGELLSALRPDLPLFCFSARRARTVPGTKVASLGRECYWLDRATARTGARVVSSFLMRSHIIALFTKLLLRSRLRVVLNVHEHMTDSAAYLYPTWPDRRLMRAITRHVFPRADLIVAVAEGVKLDLVRNFGIPAEKIVVHNPVHMAEVRQRASEPLTHPLYEGAGGRRVVAVGRLVRLKGFDALVRAFARLPGPLGARLLILGDGPERGALQALIRALDLGDRVALLGMQENPWKFMARSDLFALSSRTEAFPNVLGEAMALGLPVLATACGAGGARVRGRRPVRTARPAGRRGCLGPTASSGSSATPTCAVGSPSAASSGWRRSTCPSRCKHTRRRWRTWSVKEPRERHGRADGARGAERVEQPEQHEPLVP